MSLLMMTPLRHDPGGHHRYRRFPLSWCPRRRHYLSIMGTCHPHPHYRPHLETPIGQEAGYQRKATVYRRCGQDDPWIVGTPIIITLVPRPPGHTILNSDCSEHDNGVATTLVFNTFIFAQISNLVSCGRLDNGPNVFEGIPKNRFLTAITLISTSLARAFQNVFTLIIAFGNCWSGSHCVRW